MGLLDNVIGRFGRGGKSANYEDEYDDEAYYDDEYAYDDEEEYADTNGDDSGLSLSRTGRAGYRNESHVPLISQSDVRAQTYTSLSPAHNEGSVDTPDYYASRSGPVMTRGERAGSRAPRHVPVVGVGSSTSFGSSPARGTVRTRGEGDAPVAVDLAARGRRARNLTVLAPAAYGDAEKVARALKAGDAVIVDLRHTRPELGKRILDFSYGAASALDGRADKIAERIFALTTTSKLSPDEQKQLKTQGVL
jgi:cell division inhibitor SepF